MEKYKDYTLRAENSKFPSKAYARNLKQTFLRIFICEVVEKQIMPGKFFEESESVGWLAIFRPENC